MSKALEQLDAATRKAAAAKQAKEALEQELTASQAAAQQAQVEASRYGADCLHMWAVVCACSCAALLLRLLRDGWLPMQAAGAAAGGGQQAGAAAGGGRQGGC